MYPFKRVLVSLYNDQSDKRNVSYAKYFTRYTDINEATFLYVSRKKYDIPTKVAENLSQQLEPALSKARKQMEDIVTAAFKDNKEIHTYLKVEEGVPTDIYLKEIQERNIDLVIVGKKKENEVYGLLPERLARKAPCSLMIVPEVKDTTMRKILVALDFSEHSANALKTAIAFASKAEIFEILCLHVFYVPLRYHRTGRTYTNIYYSIRDSIQEELEEYLRKFDNHGVTLTPLVHGNMHPIEAINDIAEDRETDLVFVGARGRTAAASILLGSVTEQLIRSGEYPIIAVKKKGEGMHLLDALFSS